MRGVLASAVVFAAFVTAAPAVAATPITWCGSGESRTDRADAVGGPQIHAIYAYPSDGRDRFTRAAPTIATVVNAIDAWWRGEDSTRAPRFDLASFSCETSLGALDISSVQLPHDAAYYLDASSRLSRVGADLAAGGFAGSQKKYVVFYDTSSSLPTGACGATTISARSGGNFSALWFAPNTETAAACGSLVSNDTAGLVAVNTARELVHSLGALDTTAATKPPHACADDTTSVCDDPFDVIASKPVAQDIADADLDFGNDDYYAHSGSWWDVQDSLWLRKVGVATPKLTITVGANGDVTSAQPGGSCASGSCSAAWEAGSTVTLQAAPASGYRFSGWGGACSGTGSCTVTVNADTSVSATFAAAPATTPPPGVTPTPAKPPAGFGPETLRVSVTRRPLQLVATTTLTSAVPASSVTCKATRGLAAAHPLVVGGSVTCRWTIPKNALGKLVIGTIRIRTATGDVSIPFGYRLPKR